MINLGTLYLVSTPIGHLDDLSIRAVSTLKEVAVVAAEDTRHSKKLLQHYGVTTPTLSLHEHNEKARIQSLIERLKAGESIAVVSDAGTPLISDPGYGLVNAAIEANISVVPIPGASALLTALVKSGLPSDRFTFEGFLSAKKGVRQTQLQALQQESRTIIFYESVHRIQACLEQCRDVFGGARRAAVARELTKQYEECQRGSLDQLVAWIQHPDTVIKGEYVVLIAGNDQVEAGCEQFMPTLQVLLTELPLKQAVALTVKITGVSKKTAYQAALALKEQEG